MLDWWLSWAALERAFLRRMEMVLKEDAWGTKLVLPVWVICLSMHEAQSQKVIKEGLAGLCKKFIWQKTSGSSPKYLNAGSKLEWDTQIKNQSIKVFIFIHSLSFPQQKTHLKGSNKENNIVQYKCTYFTLPIGTQELLHRACFLCSMVSRTERTLLCIVPSHYLQSW